MSPRSGRASPRKNSLILSGKKEAEEEGGNEKLKGARLTLAGAAGFIEKAGSTGKGVYYRLAKGAIKGP